MEILAGTPDVRPPASDYERRLDEAIPYWRWAEKGVLPSWVDGESAVRMNAILRVDEAVAEAREKQQQQQAARDRAAQNLRR